ncbi:glycosyltransferase family 87 protein [Rhodoplanes sp. TEM]|uniref:Glycosyltransferase family 87 protein n=1 Tax=Rhodoplanes tepidamans TaxID=200616 RepID=A0ABT5J992_RHOTP|nr:MULTISPECIES: glycosyltransferase family 87 protein [Rhodoplanes]MDC7786241.1 glycosyltransferase family 87 protein [Rhodoplanes tepidamans]MDC7982388.1 glycosyltransferase family 87 protein [Rhodoplanes sp. TEM]MDQ0355040.1 hypothetical protein [Rhodoplanes tepidamans]
MRLLEVVEALPASAGRRTTYLRALVALFGLVLALTTMRFALLPPGPTARIPVDFDAFRLAGDLVLNGRVDLAYRFADFGALLRAQFGGRQFLPWTYPPPFDLLVAPLALVPVWLAYPAAMAGTLVAYLAALRRLAPESAVPALILFAPSVLMTIRCGQNGLLTGALIAWTCAGLLAGRAETSRAETGRATPGGAAVAEAAFAQAWAGVPLGLMVIKPHLAAAFAVYVVLGGRWGVAAVAVGTAAAVSAVATLVLGPGVWVAFAGGVQEAKVFLSEGWYPLYRMVSPYAALHTMGAGPSAAMAVQIAVAVAALAAVGWAVRRLPIRPALGITAVAALLVSPYAYDYDLTIVAVGIALLLPDLIRLGRPPERAVVYLMCLVAGVFGLAQSSLVALGLGPVPDPPFGDMPVSGGGIALVVLLGLVCRIVGRGAVTAAARPRPA